MTSRPFPRVKYLAFDIFGTVMDLTSSLAGPAGDFLAAHGSDIPGEAFYAEWRERQRIEQYQDNLLMLGHSGYLETCRRAFVYCLKKHDIGYTGEAVREFMTAYEGLQPFSDAIQGNDEDIDAAGSQEGYSNVSATTGFYVDWGAEDNGILSAFLGHLKKSLPKARIYHPADQVVPVASEA